MSAKRCVATWCVLAAVPVGLGWVDPRLGDLGVLIIAFALFIRSTRAISEAR